MLNCLTARDLQEIASTIGVGFFTQFFHMPAWCTNLYIWDTSGTERFRSVITPYLRNVAIVAIVFDVTDRTTWEHVDYWRNLAIDEAKHAGDTLPLCCLVGCQTDKAEHVVTLDEMKEKARLWNECPYWKVSTRESCLLEGSVVEFFPSDGEVFQRREARRSWWKSDTPMAPRDQMLTIFGEMVVRFHTLLMARGLDQFRPETCSLGTLESDQAVICVKQCTQKKKRKCCLE